MFFSRCRIPTVFRHFSPTLFAFSVVLSLFYVSSFLSLLSQSFVFLLTSLVYICLSMLFSHYISSILSVLACFLCNSSSFLHQYFRFFVLSVVPSLSNVTSLHLSLDVVFPLHFVNSLRLCLPFLSFFCPSYVSSFLTLSFFVVVSPS